MQLNNIAKIAQKEFSGFFSSLSAYIFLGAYLGITLFIFFWVDTFFARNIADVRPMFEWMPALLIILVPALTMRMWSEERRSGTLELLLSVPVSNFELVAGKFLACMALVLTALVLTLPLPATVALMLGQLDWGPVLGGYVATLFLAAAYTAIGLYISVRSDNQIVSLLISIIVCGFFLLIGADQVTALFSNDLQELMRLIGSGSRFQSIGRGVIDFRDLYYYVSIAGVFLSLNILGLEKIRWSGNSSMTGHKSWNFVVLLSVANFIAGNFWLQQISSARMDLTDGQIYSISPATRSYLARLQEPLLIRGYFSKKTHPLMAPLVPRLRDLINEYAIAGGGKVHVEFVDPQENQEIEREAAKKYDIKPGLFRSASKYQAALTNSYFDVLIKYGDQFEKLGYRDLLEIKARSENSVDVDLRNPEYDITSAIKRVLYSYQSAGNLFLNIEQPVQLIAYVSSDHKLPQSLLKLKRTLTEALSALVNQSLGKLSFQFIDPDADGGKVARLIQSEYGFKPMVVSLLDPNSFWFYITLKSGDQMVQVSIPEDMSKSALESNIKSGLKRFARGFLQTIGVYERMPLVSRVGPDGMLVDEFAALRKKLSDAYALQSVSLKSGKVPANIDLLVLLAPDHLGEREVFAIDQFLMKGGTILVSTGSFDVNLDAGLIARPIESGLEKWLESYGINVEKTMVLDPRNFPLPIPMRRKIMGHSVQETKLIPYPYFVDVRNDGLMGDDHITAGVKQVILNWASPIVVNRSKNKERQVIPILQSSIDAWTAKETMLDPDFKSYPQFGFQCGHDKGRKFLATAIEGCFESFFKGKTSPLARDNPQSNVIEKSSNSARIVLFGSNAFLSDRMLWMAGISLGAPYFSPIELVQNAVDWSLQDRTLLTIRGRSHFARPLKSFDQNFELFFEYLNYAFALAGLGAVWLWRRHFRLEAKDRYDELLATIKKPVCEEKS